MSGLIIEDVITLHTQDDVLHSALAPSDYLWPSTP